MKDSNGSSRLNAQILEEASAWFVEFSEGEVHTSTREEFDRWLRTSPEHVRAYLQISVFWDHAPLLAKSRKLSAGELLSRVRFSTNVVQMGTGGRPRSHRTAGEHLPGSVRVRLVAIAASIALLAAVGSVIWMQLVRGTYSTEVGEQRSIILSDGTTVELNARSRIRIRFGDTERAVSLLDGQALFHVAKDAARPFVVRSDRARVRAVGTEFDVNRTRVGTIVTVLEGRVAVIPSPSDSPGPASGQDMTDEPGYLEAGEQVTVTGQSSRHPTRTDPAAVTAWRQRKLHFASSSLAEVADEYNRYHEQRLVLRDARLESFHVSGVFSATDSTSLLAFLRQQPSLNVRETDSEIEVTSK